jgi:hypothetical protein
MNRGDESVAIVILDKYLQYFVNILAMERCDLYDG